MKRADITPEKAVELIKKYGNATAATSAIISQCESDGNGKKGQIPAENTVRMWIQSAARKVGVTRWNNPLVVQSKARAAAANKFLKLLDDGGIDPQKVADGEIELKGGSFKTWGVYAKIKQKDGTEKIETKPLYAVSVNLSPSWEKGPQWPVIQPVISKDISYAAPITRIDGVKIIAFIPDMHTGFIRPINDEHRMLPIHDEAAIDIATQIVADLQPHLMVNLGDPVDLAEMSHYVKHPEHARTTQATIYKLHAQLKRFEVAAGPRFISKSGRKIQRREKTKVLGGNHGNRFQRDLLDNAKAAYGLRTADDPKGWPAMSLPHMVGFDSLGIEYVGEKVGFELWLADLLKVIHEPPKGKVQDPVNIVCAHDHKIWRSAHTVFTRTGPEDFTTYGMGCLCNLERYTDETSLLPHVTPGNWQKQRWQQCVGVGYIYKDGSHYIEQVPIHNGRAIFRGKVYEARRQSRRAA